MKGNVKMDPITEEFVCTVASREDNGLTLDQCRDLAYEMDQDLYEAVIGPAVDEFEKALLARQEGNELEVS